MNKKLIWGIVIVIVLVAGIAYYNSSIAKPVCWPYCENMTDQDREKIKESVTADWKTYVNSEYGIEFKYPQGLTVLDRSYKTPGGVVFPSLMIIAPNQEKDNSYVIVGSRTPGSTAPEISCDNTFGRCKEFGPNIVYTKSIDENIVGLFDSMIGTVKFTSPSISTTDWKTYNFVGSPYIMSGPISFKYPSNWVLDTTYYTTPGGVKNITSLTITSPSGIEQIVFSNGGNQGNHTCQTIQKINSQEPRGKIVCNMINETPFYLTYTTNSEVVEIYNRIIDSVKITN